MSDIHYLFGVPYDIPINRDKKWGSNVRAVIIALMDAVDAGFSDVGVWIKAPTNTTLSSNGTLTRTTAWHRIIGNGGPVTLNATTAITAGTTAGEVLSLSGTSDTNTVTILDGAKTDMNGAWVGSLGDVIQFHWDATRSLWVEEYRNS